MKLSLVTALSAALVSAWVCAAPLSTNSATFDELLAKVQGNHLCRLTLMTDYEHCKLIGEVNTLGDDPVITSKSFDTVNAEVGYQGDLEAILINRSSDRPFTSHLNGTVPSVYLKTIEEVKILSTGEIIYNLYRDNINGGPFSKSTQMCLLSDGVLTVNCD